MNASPRNTGRRALLQARHTRNVRKARTGTLGQHGRLRHAGVLRLDETQSSVPRAQVP